MPHMSGVHSLAHVTWPRMHLCVCVGYRPKSTSCRFVVLLCAVSIHKCKEKRERERKRVRERQQLPLILVRGLWDLSQLRSSSDRCSEGLGLPA